MKNNHLILFIGLAVALGIVVFGNNDYDFSESEAPPQDDPFVEFSSVLWKARVYDNRIDFVVDDNVFHTVRFGIGERHVGSISYRNLNGYYDPVLVTVWTRGHGSDSGQRAMVIDPVSKTVLAEVASEHEVDVSISDENRIVLAYSESPGEAGNQTPVEYAYAWPEPAPD